jgi:large subunit ribosomal protein L4
MSKTNEMSNPRNTDEQVSRSIKMQELKLEQPLRMVSRVAFATSLRVLMQNWRQGTVACKGRSDVARSNKKPWKQKGTGRARAGSFRSPLWRGGGVIHGPQARSKELSILKKLRRQVFAGLLLNFVEDSRVMCFDWVPALDIPKTKAAYTLLKEVGLHDKKNVLFVMPGDDAVHCSFSNIANVQVMYFDHPNTFDLAQADNWLFLKKDFDEFKGMVSRWI